MNIEFEQSYWQQKVGIMGIDEVGRGSKAGPVVVGAVVFPINHKLIEGVNDSKKLSRKMREALEPRIREQALAIGLGQAEADEIDQIGIVAAIRKAADSAIEAMKIEGEAVIVSDGPKPLNTALAEYQSMAVIGGDAKIYSVAAASVVAKVYRDELMRLEAVKYPKYGFETSVGYGTRYHLAAIRKFGLTPLHRKTYCKGY